MFYVYVERPTLALPWPRSVSDIDTVKLPIVILGLLFVAGRPFNLFKKVFICLVLGCDTYMITKRQAAMLV